MLRYALAVAGAAALISTAAFAQMGETGPTTVITKQSPDGLAQKKVIIHRHDDGYGTSKRVIIHRHDNGYGAMTTKKIIPGGGYGSSTYDRTDIDGPTRY